MKSKICFLALSFFLNFIYAIDIPLYLKRDVKINNVNYEKGTKIFHRWDDLFFESAISQKFKIYGVINQKRLEFDMNDLLLEGEHIEIPDKLKNSFWIMDYYYDYIYKQSDEFLFTKEKYWTDKEMLRGLDEAQGDWLDYFGPATLFFGGNYIYTIGNGVYDRGFSAIGYIDNINNDRICLKILKSHIGIEASHEECCIEEFKKLNKKNLPYNLLIVLDGDYISLYIDKIQKENFVCRLAKADKNTYTQIKNFAGREGKEYDLSEITWPHHADGSCDYDLRNRNFSITNKQEQPTYCNGIQIDKIMTVQENLKLRNLPASIANSVVLKVMAPGTKVKITDVFFPEETIDGITSIWVQVHVQDVGKDPEGKPIAAGWNGWCFGGYLK